MSHDWRMRFRLTSRYIYETAYYETWSEGKEKMLLVVLSWFVRALCSSTMTLKQTLDTVPNGKSVLTLTTALILFRMFYKANALSPQPKDLSDTPKEFKLDKREMTKGMVIFLLVGSVVPISTVIIHYYPETFNEFVGSIVSEFTVV